MGRILVDRTMEMLITAYHSRAAPLRIVGGPRAHRRPSFLEQDGIYGALHTVSKDGAANYLDQPANAKAAGHGGLGLRLPAGPGGDAGAAIALGAVLGDAA